jgi:3-hydroxybutyryl-CoA dehydrogenase
MGIGIAEAVAGSGYEVMIRDIELPMVEDALKALSHRLQRRVEQGRITAEHHGAVLQRIHAVADVADLAGSDLVIEAVSEDVGIKRDLFAALERICRADALLVTNTSTLSPTEIGAATSTPHRTAGLHFFNPAPVMRLVEVVPGLATAPETVSALKDFVSSLDKTPVVVSDSPGGIVSRLLITVRNEAVRMLMEGVASAEDIDTALRLGAGWPMGPLAMIDLVGVDLHVTNSDSLARELGDRFQPPTLLRKMARAGHFGRKSGRGFYTYPHPQ